MVSINDFKKTIAYWIVPQGFQEILLKIRVGSCWGIQKSAQEKLLLKKNLTLKGIHQGQRCFILATGSSIKNQDLKLLQGETCIAVSNFLVHPDYTIINPKYYCIAPYHLPITEEAWQKWMDEIEKGTGTASIFFGLSDKDRNEKNGRFKNRDLYYLRFGGSWSKNTPPHIDISQTIPGPQSVTIMALYIALYMGFKEIYLLGCDHDWLLHLNNSSHFYPEDNHTLVKSGYNEWFQEDLEEMFQSHVTLWQQYKKIYEIAKKNNIQICNATDGGLLDVFPRVRYEVLFKICSEKNE